MEGKNEFSVIVKSTTRLLNIEDAADDTVRMIMTVRMVVMLIVMMMILR